MNRNLSLTPWIPLGSRDTTRGWQNCTRCGYRLRGLPRSHVCPECGEPYDYRTCEIELRGAQRHWFELAGAALFEVALVAGIWRGVAELWGAALFFGVYMVVVVWRIVAGRNDRIVLTDDAIDVVVGGRRQAIPVADIHIARFDRVRRRLELVDQAANTIVRLSAAQVGGSAKARAAAKRINNWLGHDEPS